MTEWIGPDSPRWDEARERACARIAQSVLRWRAEKAAKEAAQAKAGPESGSGQAAGGSPAPADGVLTTNTPEEGKQAGGEARRAPRRKAKRSPDKGRPDQT